jgi:DNA polymerase I-like protein with 3'-5' exonuclease and polymerase domains
MSSIIDLWNAANIRGIDEAAIEMEQNGFMLDSEFCARGLEVAEVDERKALDTLATTCELLGARRESIAVWDDVWTSTKQLSDLLENELHIPPSPYKTKGRVNVRAGERSTDKRAVEWMLEKTTDVAKRTVLETLLELRKIRSSMKYLRKLPTFVGPDGYIHPTTGPAGDSDDRVGAITWRFAMKNPEGQQIPKDPRKDRYFIRRAFIAPPGMKLVVSDYTALEVVILANISEILFGDTLLLDLTMPGMDVHAYNAHRIFGDLLDYRTESGRRVKDLGDPKLYKSDPELVFFRDIIKTIWYKLTYGGSAYSFGMSLKDKDGELLGEKRAQVLVDALYAACPPLRKWHDWVEAQLVERGTICAMNGAEANYSETIKRGEWGLKAACRAGGNYPMQATGAAVIGAAMYSIVRCPELRRLGALFQLQIHDENQLRCPEAVAKSHVAPLLLEHMKNAYPLKNLAATVGIADNWQEAK